jgi:GrpB-like predicted nucleotidyltransferase (UPF0157 family)
VPWQCAVRESKGVHLRNERDDSARCEDKQRPERYLGYDDDACFQWGVIRRDRDTQVRVPGPLPQRLAASGKGPFTSAELDDCSRVLVAIGKSTLERRPDLEVCQILSHGILSQLLGESRVRESEPDGHGPVWQINCRRLGAAVFWRNRIRRCNTWPVDESKPILITAYDPAWPAYFNEIHGYVWPALDGLALRIDHVGSTAVVGLAAKPIIDMDIVVAGGDLITPTIERLAAIGYEWVGDLGVEGRQAFRLVPEKSLPEHHPYLVIENNRAHVDHWLLRDLLGEDAKARDRYAALKRENAAVAAGDLDVYTARKAAFVAELLRGARQQRRLPEVSYWVPNPDELLPLAPRVGKLDQRP